MSNKPKVLGIAAGEKRGRIMKKRALVLMASAGLLASASLMSYMSPASAAANSIEPMRPHQYTTSSAAQAASSSPVKLKVVVHHVSINGCPVYYVEVDNGGVLVLQPQLVIDEALLALVVAAAGAGLVASSPA